MAFVSRLGVPCRQGLGVIIKLTGMGTVYSIGGYPRKPAQGRGLCLNTNVIEQAFFNNKVFVVSAIEAVINEDGKQIPPAGFSQEKHSKNLLDPFIWLMPALNIRD